MEGKSSAPTNAKFPCLPLQLPSPQPNRTRSWLDGHCQRRSKKQCCFWLVGWRALRAELVGLQSFSAVGKEGSSWHANQKQRSLKDLTFSCFSVSCKWITAPRLRGFACRTPQKQQKRNCRNTAPGRFFPCSAEAEDKTGGLFCPFNSLFRYNMRRQEEQGRQDLEQGMSSQRHSSDQDISQEGKLQELLNNDQKIEELHRSVQRLREFVAALPERGTPSLPPSVEQYCDKMSQYRVKEESSVVELAERRVNKMLRNRKIKRNWNNEDITLLVWLVSKRIQLLALPHFSDLGKNDWEFISSLIAGSTWQKCKFKWLSLKKVKLVTHKWSKMESRLLAEAIGQEDKINWKLVSEKLYEKNMAKNKVFRTAKQCREHWNCFLNPNIHKGPWSIQEDRKLLEYVLELEGSKKWSEIAKFMEGRTENALKNRFNLLVNSQRKISGHLTEKRLLKICLNRLMLEEGQQERLEMQSPIAEPLPEEGQELVESAEAEEFQNRDPIVPTVSEPNTFNSSVGFRPSYESMLNYLNGGVLSAPQMMGQNAVYIGFLFPGQYL